MWWPFRREMVALSGEEARTALKALQRSSEAMPDMTETFRSREMRAMRETKLAARISRMIKETEQ